ncbi:hypothetical protein C0Q70_08543 [Pomacea canaliculata]|uniref:Uncharacterized protein n=1 Tax=Pomacea canaliculata TaxID=400727 RepID=A0A2T7PI54_POMCA|nr:hypothetical protein C0Q70_08543 [Pomacea canaliculata]
MKALRDTGADVLVVDADLVAPTDLLPTHRSITMASKNEVRSCPTALVRLQSPFYCGEAIAVVLANLVVPVIIGNHIERRDGTKVPVSVHPPLPPVPPPPVAVVTHSQARRDVRGLRVIKPFKTTNSVRREVDSPKTVRVNMREKGGGLCDCNCWHLLCQLLLERIMWANYLSRLAP